MSRKGIISYESQKAAVAWGPKNNEIAIAETPASGTSSDRSYLYFFRKDIDFMQVYRAIVPFA